MGSSLPSDKFGWPLHRPPVLATCLPHLPLAPFIRFRSGQAGGGNLRRCRAAISVACWKARGSAKRSAEQQTGEPAFIYQQQHKLVYSGWCSGFGRAPHAKVRM